MGETKGGGSVWLRAVSCRGRNRMYSVEGTKLYRGRCEGEEVGGIGR